jgi:CheY-like chemotaxis protein
LAILLKSAGYDVQTRYGGLEAIAAAEALSPDIVILDIGMPVMNGYEACQTLRQQPAGGNMKIIALTGWGQDSDVQHALDAGFDAHLVKPPKVARLKELLRALLVDRRDQST